MQSAVFAVVFGVLSSGAIILTLNVLLLVSTSPLVSSHIPASLSFCRFRNSVFNSEFRASDWKSGMYSRGLIVDGRLGPETGVSKTTTTQHPCLLFSSTFSTCFSNPKTPPPPVVSAWQGGKIVFFQSLSVLGYCLFPLDIAALVCSFISSHILRTIIIGLTLAWSSWSAYPFVSGAVPAARRALAVYPVFLLFISVGFLVLANN